jgi:hypothetical protein
LVRHAGVVASSLGGLAFMGRSGRGKSTLSAAFSQRGIPLVTDDCLLLQVRADRYYAVPSYPGARLWDDVIPSLFAQSPVVTPVAQYSTKKRIRPDGEQLRFSEEAVPLARIYSLGVPEEAVGSPILIRKLSSRDAFMELVNHTCFLDITDRRRLHEEFEAVSGLASRFPVYRLAYRHDLSILPAVQDAILKHAESVSDSEPL